MMELSAGNLVSFLANSALASWSADSVLVSTHLYLAAWMDLFGSVLLH